MQFFPDDVIPCQLKHSLLSSMDNLYLKQRAYPHAPDHKNGEINDIEPFLSFCKTAFFVFKWID